MLFHQKLTKSHLLGKIKNQAKRKSGKKIVEDHKILGRISEGGTSITYKVIDTRTKQIMCKKVLKVSSEETSFQNLQNALKEFQILYEMNHQFICRAIGINMREPIKIEGDENNEESIDESFNCLFLKF